MASNEPPSHRADSATVTPISGGSRPNARPDDGAAGAVDRPTVTPRYPSARSPIGAEATRFAVSHRCACSGRDASRPGGAAPSSAHSRARWRIAGTTGPPGHRADSAALTPSRRSAVTPSRARASMPTASCTRSESPRAPLPMRSNPAKPAPRRARPSPSRGTVERPDSGRRPVQRRADMRAQSRTQGVSGQHP